ncbi:hypothetical protein ACHAXS_000470 [Conticribra weissflogii]
MYASVINKKGCVLGDDMGLGKTGNCSFTRVYVAWTSDMLIQFFSSLFSSIDFPYRCSP